MKYSRIISVFLFVLAAFYSSNAQEPLLRHVFDIHAKCSEALNLGKIPEGLRVMIPITGGNTEGEIKAVILPGGADYQLISNNGERVRFEAVYTLQTPDSCLINVRNVGVSTSGSRGDYFTTSPVFEAPTDSKYDWLNNRIFLCRPLGFSNGTVHLRVWTVE